MNYFWDGLGNLQMAWKTMFEALINITDAMRIPPFCSTLHPHLLESFIAVTISVAQEDCMGFRLEPITMPFLNHPDINGELWELRIFEN